MLELPAEIRDRVYSEFWASNGFIRFLYGGVLFKVQHRRTLAVPVWTQKTWDRVDFHRPLESLSFLLANKQVFQEALEELARNSAWRLEDGHRFDMVYGMSGPRSASTYRTIVRPSPQNFSPWRSQSLDLVVALYVTHHCGRGRARNNVLPYKSATLHTSQFTRSEPYHQLNIRHLSLTLHMRFDDIAYSHEPYMFHLEKLYGWREVLPCLRTVDIFLAPSPELQRPPRIRRAWHATYYKFGTVDTAGIEAATPDLLELGHRLLGSQGVVGRYEGWKREMHVFRFEKVEDETTK